MLDFYLQFAMWFLAFFAGYALQRYIKRKFKKKPEPEPSSYQESREYSFVGGSHNGEWHEVPVNSKFWHLVKRSKDYDIINHGEALYDTCSIETYEHRIFLCHNGRVYKEEYHLVKG